MKRFAAFLGVIAVCARARTRIKRRKERIKVLERLNKL